MTTTPIESWESGLDAVIRKQVRNPSGWRYNEIEDFIRTKLAESFKAGERKGRADILRELQHDQRKLLDGFAHPKGCEMCARHAGEVSKEV